LVGIDRVSEILCPLRTPNDKNRRGEISFVNRTIAGWSQLLEGAIGTSPVKTHTFRKRVKKVKIREVK
jgi:hypothetical protein